MLTCKYTDFFFFLTQQAGAGLKKKALLSTFALGPSILQDRHGNQRLHFKDKWTRQANIKERGLNPI